MEDLETYAQPAEPVEERPEPPAQEPAVVSMDDLMGPDRPVVEDQPAPPPIEDAPLKAVLEAIVYVAEEPATVAQLAAALGQPPARIQPLLDQIVAEFERPEHGLMVKEVAGGYKMATKPEHHDAVRTFVKSLKPPLKLSLPALETLAVVAYKQPVTAPEIMEIRGVQGAGVIKTLLDRKLIAAAGRKDVLGKPILYKTTREFMIQFGLKDLGELPSLKEFEDLRRMALADDEPPAPVGQDNPVEEPVEPAIVVSGLPTPAQPDDEPVGRQAIVVSGLPTPTQPDDEPAPAAPPPPESPDEKRED